MKPLTYKQFEERKQQFFRKHDGSFRVETSPMDSFGQYHKSYIFDDGATWEEHMRPVYVTTSICVRETTIPVEVKLLETESWNTDDSISVFYYEGFNHEKTAKI